MAFRNSQTFPIHESGANENRPHHAIGDVRLDLLEGKVDLKHIVTGRRTYGKRLLEVRSFDKHADSLTSRKAIVIA